MGRGRTLNRELKVATVHQVVLKGQRPGQVCREHGMAEGLLLRWRREYATHGEAAFHVRGDEHGGLRAQGCGVGAFLRATRIGDRGAKKGAARTAVAERDAMIATMHEACSELSIRRLCELAGAGRTWYYARLSAAHAAARDTALPDAIKRIVLEFQITGIGG